jgi:23S rRNA (pseudouridine1915-N3)-methyltransferase
MRLVIAAVGRLKAGPERELAERYRERVARIGRPLGIGGIEVIDIRESPAREAERRLVEEAVALATLIPEGAVTVLLDPRGESMASEALAAQLRAWRDGDRPNVCFVIGGADGLGAALRRQADLVLAFGAATWPHQLVRIMLLEQIYRALTMLSGHPYHRD